MRRLAALLAVVFLTACTTEIDQSTRPSTVAGSYQLHSYGGKALPVLVSTDANGTWEIVSGQLVIGSDQSWTETVDYRVTNGTKVTPTSVGSSGSWTFVRDNAYMMFNDKVYNYQFTGTAAGGSVTLELLNGNALVYSR